MFTGLIETIAKIERAERRSNSMQLTLQPEKPLDNIIIGESIACDGACLTVTKITGNSLSFFVSDETIRKSSLAGKKGGDMLNLERAMLPSERLGGHLVQGHVDTIGKITSITQSGQNWTFEFEVDSKFQNLMIPKGSIALDGISLTIAELKENRFSTAVIPHTFHHTTLKLKKVNDEVNVEFDMIGKYVQRYLASQQNSNLSIEKLKNAGFM